MRPREENESKNGLIQYQDAGGHILPIIGRVGTVEGVPKRKEGDARMSRRMHPGLTSGRLLSLLICLIL